MEDTWVGFLFKYNEIDKVGVCRFLNCNHFSEKSCENWAEHENENKAFIFIKESSILPYDQV